MHRPCSAPRENPTGIRSAEPERDPIFVCCAQWLRAKLCAAKARMDKAAMEVARLEAAIGEQHHEKRQRREEERQ